MDLLAECTRMIPIYTVGHVLVGGRKVINTGGVQAYIMDDDTLLIPGTNSSGDWWSFNLQTSTVLGRDIDWADLDKAVGNARWHKGFAKHARILYHALGGWRPRAIVGHSLGGASAQILGAYLGVPTLAIATPRARKGSHRLKNEGWVLNVVYEKDLVTQVPPKTLGFRYAGSVEVMTRVPGVTKALHNPADYLPVMQAEIAAGTLRSHFP
ncbi:hypothetical protein Jann_0918 [Jannaschia sp. CCS1]|nr:hypothetical protein Jann_0918 [Jannaschia sp. CCS1]